MRKVLITGFEPFNNARINPTQELVKQLKLEGISGVQLITHVLPVVYSESAQILLELIVDHQPDVVISFGQAEGRKAVTPEKFAVNLDDATIADNSGDKRVDQFIHVSSPTAFESTLPVKDLVAAIKDADIPAALSLSAGSFVCNHIFYEMQKTLHGSKVRSGFVHVPLIKEQQEDFPELYTMELADIVSAARVIVKEVIRSLEK
jgi:pyroglutamyl-peptidase